VRVDLRRSDGPEVFAALATPLVLALLRSGENVLLDAIFSIEQYRYYQQQCGAEVLLVAITASFDARSDRVRNRSGKTLTPEQLRARDETDLKDLRIDLTMAQAYCEIANEGSLEWFKEELERVWQRMACKSQ
jgi:hypothetical protein